MVGITTDPATSLSFRKGGVTQTLAYKDDVVAWTKRVEPRVSVDASDVVFVGYGVQAPEFQWDDYKGVDLAGKTVIMLINDPPVPDPADPSRARPEDVRRPRHDLLRPLDLQVRDGRREEGGGRASSCTRPGRRRIRSRSCRARSPSSSIS